VQQLRDLHDDIIALSAHCNGDLNIIETLRKQQTNIANSQPLEHYTALLLGNIESLTVLQNRIRNLIDLVCIKMQALVSCADLARLKLQNAAVNVHADCIRS
jgi:hypothetical protein